MKKIIGSLLIAIIVFTSCEKTGKNTHNNFVISVADSTLYRGGKPVIATSATIRFYKPKTIPKKVSKKNTVNVYCSSCSKFSNFRDSLNNVSLYYDGYKIATIKGNSFVLHTDFGELNFIFEDPAAVLKLVIDSRGIHSISGRTIIIK